MIPMVATFVGLAGAAAIICAITAFLPAPEPKPGTTTLRQHAVRIRARFSRTDLLRLGGGIAGGIVASVVFSWPLLAALVPVAAFLVPRLLSNSEGKRRIAKLEAIESWTRGLAGLVGVQGSLTQALIASRESAPALISDEVGRLAAQLASRWDPRVALRAFADELDDPSADVIVSHLLLASTLNGAGLIAALGQAADSVREEAEIRQEIESARASHRQAMMWLTVIVGVAVAIAAISPLVMTGSPFAIYRTPQGQLLLTALIAAFLAAIWLMSRMGRIRDATRLFDEYKPPQRRPQESLR